MPPGLSIDPSSGVVSGTIDYAAAEDFGGSYNPTVVVADDHGGATQSSFANNKGMAQTIGLLAGTWNFKDGDQFKTKLEPILFLPYRRF